MSKIEICGRSGACVALTIYKTTLQNYIDRVFKAINETDEGIVWYICNEEDLPNNWKPKWKIQMHSMAFHAKPRYGVCDYRNRKIWISTAALRSAAFPPTKSGKERLVEVIIDEYTHIKTQAGHDSDIYNKKKCEYLQKYYNFYPYLETI